MSRCRRLGAAHAFVCLPRWSTVSARLAESASASEQHIRGERADTLDRGSL